MSKIDDLIAKYCPNGVEYKPVGIVLRPLPKGTLKQDQLEKDGQYPVINSGRDFYGYYSLFNNDCEAIVIASRGEYAGFISYMSGKFWAGGLCYPYAVCDTSILFPKYVFYYLKSQEQYIMDTLVSRGSIPALNKSDMDKVQVPVPPLAVQEEIVNILDSFTLLEAELEAELVARKKQYEHYRDKLLNFADISQGGVRTMAINQLCEVSRGRVMSKDYLRENIGDYPVYSSQTANNGELGKINTFDYDGEYLTWTTDGANAGSVFYRNGKFSVTNVCGLLKSKTNDVSMKYLSYCLGNVAKKYVNEGMGNPKLMSNVMEKIKVPIPPLEEQERIVSILDKFDALVNDISDGLPAEINARRQQYEYYRDKLLNFEPIAA